MHLREDEIRPALVHVRGAAVEQVVPVLPAAIDLVRAVVVHVRSDVWVQRCRQCVEGNAFEAVHEGDVARDLVRKAHRLHGLNN